MADMDRRRLAPGSGQGAEAKAAVAELARTLIEARALPLDLQRPAHFAREPRTPRLGLAAYDGKIVMRRTHQWRHQQSAQAGAKLFVLEALPPPAYAAAVPWTVTIRRRRSSRRRDGDQMVAPGEGAVRRVDLRPARSEPL